MPKDKISEYAFTPAANTDIGGINIDEGCAPSGINNAIRTLMTQIRDLQAGVSGDTIPLTAGGTGSGTAASARAALGLAIGTNVLGYVTPGASGNVLQSDGTNWTSVAQSAAVTLDTITGGPLTVAKGGTGATALASGSVLLGNGTSRVQFATAGATGQVLTSTGTGWSSQAAATSGFTNMQVFDSPGTFTTPSTTTTVKITLVGAGGPGGAGGSTPSPGGTISTTGGMGGGGGFSQGVFTVTGSTGYPVTVGTAGGTSSFSSLISATGGTAGGAAAPSVPATPNGTGGSGSGGSFNLTGNPAALTVVANRGSSIYGTGSLPVGNPTPGPSSTPGSAGLNYASGGGGGRGPGATGGAGGPGIVIVEF